MIKTDLIFEPYNNVLDINSHPDIDYSNAQYGISFVNTIDDPDLLLSPDEKIRAVHANGELEELLQYDYLSIAQGEMPTKYGVYEVKVNLEGYSDPHHKIITCQMLFNRIQGNIRGIVKMLNEKFNEPRDKIDDPKKVQLIRKRTAMWDIELIRNKQRYEIYKTEKQCTT